MRKIMIVLFLYCSAYSQEHYKISDANFKKLIAVNDEVAKNVKLVESSLNSNQNKLVLGSVEIFDPYIDVIKKPLNKLSDKQQKKINDLVCIECYETWYQQQLTARNKTIHNTNRQKDSLEVLRLNKIALQQKSKDSLPNALKSKLIFNTSVSENPYNVLQRSLYAFSDTNKNLAVFRNMDFNYAGPQLSGYLQNEMAMASKSFKIGDKDIIEKFIPKASGGNEYLNVKYLITKRTDITGMYESDEVLIIDAVEITGTPNLIVELFLNYWPKKVKVGGYKKGNIAFKELLGDYVTISGVSPKLYRIKITKGNMDVNYETTFGINKKK